MQDQTIMTQKDFQGISHVQHEHILWDNHNAHRYFEIKQKYSQVGKAAGKHFNVE